MHLWCTLKTHCRKIHKTSLKHTWKTHPWNTVSKTSLKKNYNYLEWHLKYPWYTFKPPLKSSWNFLETASKSINHRWSTHERHALETLLKDFWNTIENKYFLIIYRFFIHDFLKKIYENLNKIENHLWDISKYLGSQIE